MICNNNIIYMYIRIYMIEPIQTFPFQNEKSSVFISKVRQ